MVAATSLFQNPRAGTTVDYLDVLTAQRELLDARRLLIDTKREQLSAVINTYQALGGGGYLFPIPIPPPLQSHHWWKHSSHSVANTAVGSGPEPPPTPAAAPGSGSGPLPAPTLAPPSGPGPFPTPAAASGPQSPSKTGGGKGAGTASKTGGGKGSRTASNTDVRRKGVRYYAGGQYSDVSR